MDFKSQIELALKNVGDLEASYKPDGLMNEHKVIAAAILKKTRAVVKDFAEAVNAQAEQIQKSYSKALKDSSDKAMVDAKSQLEQEFVQLYRCQKCSANKIAIKYSKLYDKLECRCSVCAYEWLRDCIK